MVASLIALAFLSQPADRGLSHTLRGSFLLRPGSSLTIERIKSVKKLPNEA